MRKLTSVFLVLAMLTAFSSSAFASSDEDYVFEIRDGIKWGMTSERVQELEANDNIEDVSLETEEGHHHKLLGEYPVRVSKYDGAVVTFCFCENSLYSIDYIINDQPVDEAYLVKAMSTQYGEEEELSLLQTAEVLLHIVQPLIGLSPALDVYKGMTPEDLVQGTEFAPDFDFFHVWILPDQTEVSLMADEAIGCLISYYNGAFEKEQFVTDGL